jgi:glycosyltransferase involved in cell wall biosynthesis
MNLPIRVAICADYPEEGWPSMDRVAANLVRHLAGEAAEMVDAQVVCPPFRRGATKLTSAHPARKVDRAFNRIVAYPRYLGRLRADFDVFHVVDHSYSWLVHALPRHRTIVTCHDLDAFRSVLAPAEERRSTLFRAATRRLLAGLQQAALISCDTAAVRRELIAHGIARPEQALVAPIGVGCEFSPEADPDADDVAAALLQDRSNGLDVLHVGSAAPRKRVDFLLTCCAEVRRVLPGLRLLRAGGPFTVEQQRLVHALGLDDAVLVLPHIDDRVLAAVYRRAALVLLPSDREGFGLPVVEALACGTPVVATDLPVLREVGGRAVAFCTSGQAADWVQTVSALLRERVERPTEWQRRREAGIKHARQFSWKTFSQAMAAAYVDVAMGNLSEAHPCLA